MTTKRYLIGVTLAELPIILLTTLIFTIPTYSLTGLRRDMQACLFYFCVYLLYSGLCVSWAQFLASLMPNGEMAQAVSGLFMAIFSLFAGYVVSF